MLGSHRSRFEFYENKYPALFYFLLGTKGQKEIYGGELFPSHRFLDFFQEDRDKNPKGLLNLNLRV
jgi:hypothetical protein